MKTIRLKIINIIFLISILTSCLDPNGFSIHDVYENRNNSDVVNYNPTAIKLNVEEKPLHKKNVDILFLLYMDGDNNLEQGIYKDFKETVYGYSFLKETDNVEVIVLWDGCTAYPDSKLYRIGTNHTYYDISDNISWLHTENDNRTEVSMNDIRTLQSFLSWANDNYSAKNIIFQFSDHGAGPGDLYLRAACQDANSSIGTRELLGTQDVRIAVQNSGIGKLDLVIQDVCLGSNIEEIYEYKDIANYMLLSPNLTPYEGHNYVNLVSSLTEGKAIHNGVLDIEEYISLNIKNYIDIYKINSSVWEKYREEIKKLKNKESVTDLELSLYPFALPKANSLSLTHASVSTITGIKVSEVTELKKAIDDMVELIIDDENHKVRVTQGNLQRDVSYNLVMKIIMNQIVYPYQATSGPIYDIGFLADEIIKIASDYQWTELVSKAENVKNKLDNIIIESWRDGVGGALYKKTIKDGKSGIAPYDKGSYGIAIAGYEYILDLNQQYTNNLLFATDSQWDEFMKKVSNVY